MAMVMLSTAAWACDWCNDPEYQSQKLGPLKSGVSFVAPDPTAWKLERAKVMADTAKKATKEIERVMKEPDSRYRLEKNEVTGYLRIMKFNGCQWEFFADQSGLLHIVWINEKAMKEWLEQLRAMEREDKAWRPVK